MHVLSVEEDCLTSETCHLKNRITFYYTLEFLYTFKHLTRRKRLHLKWKQTNKRKYNSVFL